MGPGPTMWRSSSALSVTSRVSGPAWSERGRERDHPVARARAVGRLQADDPREARPAGGSSRRYRCRAPRARGPPRRPRRSRRRSRRGRAVCPTGSEPARTPSSRSTSPSQTRPGWSCRAASAPASVSCRTTVAVYGRPVALEDLRAGLARNALRAEEVLDGERHARQRRVRRQPIGRRRLGDPA